MQLGSIRELDFLGYNCLLDNNHTPSSTREVYLSRGLNSPKKLINYPNLWKLAFQRTDLTKESALFLSRSWGLDAGYLVLNFDKSSYKADLILFLSSSSLIFPNLLDSTFPEGDSKTV